MDLNNNDLTGILLLDKPTNMTSHDVVNIVRKKLNMKKIGHAGTLDPLATGLLMILVGNATKSSQFLIDLDKEYQATIKLGETTDSYDSKGKTIEIFSVPELNQKQISNIIKEFVGHQLQTPPMFSAKKINGVTLYKIARQGKIIEREAKLITIYSFTLISFDSPLLDVLIHCSKGTYIRTIAHDLGQKLNCGAHLIQLRRTKISNFDVQNALKLNEFNKLSINQIKDNLIPATKLIVNY